MNNEEIWKPIPNYESRYLISNKGNIYSLTRNKTMNPRLDRYGYYKVRLYDGNVKKDYTVHRLVALTFIPNPNDYPCVNHIDENKTNNNVENLEWCTVEYNSNYGSSIRKSAYGRSKPIIQSDIDGNPIAIYLTASALSNAGYKRENCQTCARGITNTAYGYKWDFINDSNELREVVNESLHLKAGV